MLLKNKIIKNVAITIKLFQNISKKQKDLKHFTIEITFF